MELSKDRFRQELDCCLRAAIQGQAYIVPHDGERYVALVSMAEYAQLQHLKTRLQQVGLQLL